MNYNLAHEYGLQRENRLPKPISTQESKEYLVASDLFDASLQVSYYEILTQNSKCERYKRAAFHYHIEPLQRVRELYCAPELADWMQVLKQESNYNG